MGSRIHRGLSLMVLLVLVLCSTASGAATACEKHLNGHQNSSDTEREASKR